MENKEIIEKLRIDSEYYGDFGKQYISNSDIKVLRENPEAYRLPVESNENLEKGIKKRERKKYLLHMRT